MPLVLENRSRLVVGPHFDPTVAAEPFERPEHMSTLHPVLVLVAP